MCDFFVAVDCQITFATHPREALLREGHFGPYNGRESMKALLETAYTEFQQWRKANKIACSQRSFAPRHLLKQVHGYYLTAKAYNGRIVMQWLSSKLQDVAQHAAATPSIRLHATALQLCCSVITQTLKRNAAPYPRSSFFSPKP